LKRCSLWTYLLSILSWFFTVVYSGYWKSQAWCQFHTCAISASTCTKMFILTLSVNDFHFPLLSTFQSLAVKEIGSYEAKSHGHRETEEFYLDIFLFNASLRKKHLLYCSGNFWNTYQTWERDCSHGVTDILICNVIKAGLTHELLGLQQRENTLMPDRP
jgi:hypothetical protein